MKVDFKTLGMVVFAGGVVLTGTFIQAQQDQSKSMTPMSSGAPHDVTPGKMPETTGKSSQMMAMHEHMMADVKSMDQKLDQKLALMNAAKGNAKINAIVAVINEMASQHKEMMVGMHGQMMEQPAHPDGDAVHVH